MSSKSFYMSGAWEQHERRWRTEENRYSEYEGAEQETRTAGGRSRKAVKASVTGFDSTEVHYKGDPVVILKEEPVGNGDDVKVYFERYSQDGRPIGTYASTWRKDGRGKIVSAGGARRIFSFGG